MEERIKNLEIEVAYLRKELMALVNLLKNKGLETHYHFSSILLGDEYIKKHGKDLFKKKE